MKNDTGLILNECILNALRRIHAGQAWLLAAVVISTPGQVLNPAQFKCQLDAGSPVRAAADPPQGMVLPGLTHPLG